MGVGVVRVTGVARTMEAAGRVDARAVVAHVRHQRALVDLFGPVGHRVHDQAGSRSAQQQVFLYGREHTRTRYNTNPVGNTASDGRDLLVLGAGQGRHGEPHAWPIEQQHIIRVWLFDMDTEQRPSV